MKDERQLWKWAFVVHDESLPTPVVVAAAVVSTSAGSYQQATTKAVGCCGCQWCILLLLNCVQWSTSAAHETRKKRSKLSARYQRIQISHETGSSFRRSLSLSLDSWSVDVRKAVWLAFRNFHSDCTVVSFLFCFFFPPRILFRACRSHKSCRTRRWTRSRSMVGPAVTWFQPDKFFVFFFLLGRAMRNAENESGLRVAHQLCHDCPSSVCAVAQKVFTVVTFRSGRLIKRNPLTRLSQNRWSEFH